MKRNRKYKQQEMPVLLLEAFVSNEEKIIASARLSRFSALKRKYRQLAALRQRSLSESVY